MKTSSEADYGEPQQSSVSGGDDSGSESPYDVPKVAPRGAGDSLGLKLALIPEDQRGETSMRNRRRVFQNRRRSRACDACRLRKTKCDTPGDNGPCTSCAGASLVCKFSEIGDERRKAGPARRLRMLEAHVKDLTNKLEQANALLIGVGCPPVIAANESSRANATSEARAAYTGPITSIASSHSISSRESESGLTQPKLVEPTLDLINASYQFIPPDANSFKLLMPDQNSCMSRLPDAHPNANTAPTIQNYRDNASDPRNISPQEVQRPNGSGQGDGPSTWDGNFYGSSSTPSFMTSYREYLERLGFALPPMRIISPSGSSLTPESNRVTRSEQNSNENILTNNQGQMRIDLRYLLPNKEVADKIKEVYWRSRQVYQPIFYWPMVERRWKRAWAEPIWEDDEDVVRGVFCIVMMFLAVGSQLAGSLYETEERQGWGYFECVRRFHNLYPTVYTTDDAIIFLLMSSYLMNSSLPSPTWMMIGATCRIFQDLGLHKMPPDNQSSQINQECRNRLFWAAYLLDRQISIVFGRPTIIQEADISVKLPGEIELSGVDASGSGSSANTNCEFEEYQPDRLIHSEDRALAVYKSLINTCRCFERVRVFRLQENGSDNDLMRMRELDNELERVWESFPSELTGEDIRIGLEPCALRPLFDLQHARLLLYRSFADFSQNLRTSCRTYCLSQSIAVCRTTARLLRRCSVVRDWEINLALRSNETVRVHIFRAGAILLLGYNMKDPGVDRVEKEEVNILLRCLKAVARRKSMRKPYQLIKMATKMFGFVPDFPMSMPGSSDPEDEDDAADLVEPKPDPMDWRKSQTREETERRQREHQVGGIHYPQNHHHQYPTASAIQGMPYRFKGGNESDSTPKWLQQHPESNVHFKQPASLTPSQSQTTHSHILPNTGDKVIMHDQNMPPHQFGEPRVSAIEPYNLLPPDPAHPNQPYRPMPNPSLMIPTLNPPGSNATVPLTEVDTQMNLSPLLFSDNGLDWNAFETMINSSTEYSNPGFADLLAQGPDLGWSYPVFSQNMSDEVVTGGQVASGNLYEISHELRDQKRAEGRTGAGEEGQRGQGAGGGMKQSGR